MKTNTQLFGGFWALVDKMFYHIKKRISDKVVSKLKHKSIL
jgi:hypothetical protein